MKYFLLDYDHESRDVHITTIEDTAEALAAYRDREGEALGTRHEVVLFYGDSIDDLRKTHSRYFAKQLHPDAPPVSLDDLKARLEQLEEFMPA